MSSSINGHSYGYVRKGDGNEDDAIAPELESNRAL
jgi:hypothetical protein